MCLLAYPRWSAFGVIVMAYHETAMMIMMMMIVIIYSINPLHAELKPICYLLSLFGTHHILHISRIRVNCVYIGRDHIATQSPQ